MVGWARSLSDLGCRSEKSAERGQILPDLPCQYRDIDQKAGEICTTQVILQPTIPKSDRLLVAWLVLLVVLPDMQPLPNACSRYSNRFKNSSEMQPRNVLYYFNQQSLTNVHVLNFLGS